uniref:Uncharacterized protein n=1 Tax=Physcomitrium patens TaxID=3218 RepID=A0A2K1IAY4_PHYPA|nr:hypothetical protein PHYPA_031009 [Physcomitrium patens]
MPIEVHTLELLRLLCCCNSVSPRLENAAQEQRWSENQHCPKGELCPIDRLAKAAAAEITGRLSLNQAPLLQLRILRRFCTLLGVDITERGFETSGTTATTWKNDPIAGGKITHEQKGKNNSGIIAQEMNHGVSCKLPSCRRGERRQDDVMCGE